MQSIWKINRGRLLVATAGGSTLRWAPKAQLVSHPKWGQVVDGDGISWVHGSLVACARDFFRSFSVENIETPQEEKSLNPNIEVALSAYSKMPSKRLVFKVMENMGPMSAKEFLIWAGKQKGYEHSRYLHNVFFETCLRARKFETALEVLQEMRENNVSIDCHLYNMLARYYLKAGMMTEAQETFNTMISSGFSPDPNLYRILFSAGVRARDKEFVESLLQNYSKVEDFNSALEVCAAAGKAGLALKVLKFMEKIDCLANLRTYELLARCLCKAKRMENALKFVESLKETGLLPDHNIYNMLVSHLFEEKRVDEALKLLSHMKDNGCQPNIQTNNNFIQGYLDCGQPEKARLHLEKMVEDGCVPTPETLKLFSKTEEEETNTEMSSNSSEIVAESQQTSNDEENDTTYKRILEICEGQAWGAETETALSGYLNKLTKKMVRNLLPNMEVDVAKTFVTWAAQQEGYTHSYFAYHALFTTLLQAGKFDSAVEVLKEMKVKGMKIYSSFSRFIRCYCKSGMMTAAEESAELIRSFGVNPSAHLYGAVLDGYLLADAHDSAAKLVQSFSGTEDFNAAISAYVRAGKADSAMEVLEIMEKKGCSANLQTFDLLVGCMCRHGRLEEALTVLENMQKNGVVGNVKIYNTLISFFCQKKRVDEALKLVTKVKEAGCKPDIMTHNSLITGYLKSGQVENAQQYMEEMKAEGCIPTMETSRCLVVNLSRAREVKKAVEEFEAAADKNEKFPPDACTCLLKGLIKEGKLEEALKIYKRMKEGAGYVDGSCYVVMLRGCCRVYRFDVVDQLRTDMRVKNLEVPVSTYVLLLRTYSNARKFKEVIALFNELQKKGLDLGGARTATAVLDALIRAHQLDIGVKFCENLVESGAKVHSRQLKHFLGLLVSTGRAGEANELTKALSDRGCIILEKSLLEMA